MKNMKNMKKIEWKKMDMTKIDIKGSFDKITEKVKDSYKRPLAIAIAAALILSAAGAGTCSIISAHRTRTIEAMRAYVDGEDLQEQDETVYVIADADGGVKKVIVSDWLKDSSKNKSIADIKSLDELEKSDAENGYTINADNANSWDANGGTYYENVSTGSDLPIDVKLSYSLDGKKMTANEIAGKSGKVTIRFDYTNNQKQTVSIDDKDTDIYVPFTVVTGTILDGASFKNVEVSNGKVVNDGSRSIVLGFALPGMQESLGLKGDDSLELPDYIEITADVTNFELTTTLTMVSNDFFNKAVDEAEEKKDGSNLSLDSLSSGINQLVDGSASLYDGTSQLLDKSSLLIDGVNQLAEGGKELRDGVITVDTALQLICSNNSKLQSGADQVFDTFLAQAQSTIVSRSSSLAALIPAEGLTKSNYHDVLTRLISAANASLSSSSQNIAAGVAAEIERQAKEKFAVAIFGTGAEGDSNEGGNNEGGNNEGDSNEGDSNEGDSNEGDSNEGNSNQGDNNQGNSNQGDNNEGDSNQGDSNQGDSNEGSSNEGSSNDSGNTNGGSIDNNSNNTASAPENNDVTPPSSGSSSSRYAQLSDDQKQIVDAKVAEWKTTAEYRQQLEQAIAAYAGSPDVQSQLAEAQGGIDALELALKQLDTFKTFYDGIYEYTNGVKQVCDGTEQLKDGAVELSSGLNQLQSSSDALVDGISQLNNGAMRLSEGMQQLSGSNLAKLLGASSGVSLSDINARFDAMRDVSVSYNSYTGSTKYGGSVKFIYRTDSVSADASK